MNPDKLILEQESPYSFDKTIEILVQKAGENSWNVPAVHDLQQSLAKSGKDVRPVKVIELCKPEFSGKMLELNHERIISAMMPCRISVYEKEDGRTYIALINMGMMAGEMAANIALVMKAASDEIIQLIKSINPH
jgi:uncharacterized protein (DUF302 family)